MTRKAYWLSCPKFTVQVDVLNGQVTWAAPVVRRFVGQPFSNLLRWQRWEVREMVINEDQDPVAEEDPDPDECRCRRQGDLEDASLCPIHSD